MNKLLKNLEYDKVLEMIASYAASAVARREIFNNVCPQKTAMDAEKLLDETEEAYRLYHNHSLRPITPFDDTVDVIEKSRVSAMLSISELRRVMLLLRAGGLAKNSILNAPEGMLLKNKVCAYFGEPTLEKDLDRAILSESELSDNASAKLKEIRTKLTNARNRLQEKIKKYSHASEVSKYLQGDLVTIRDGRYVLPVKAEYRSAVQGLIHDRSSTGATLFIEPFVVVEMNNEIRSLQIEEQQEIERILAELTERVSAIADDLSAMQEVLVGLDIIFAKMHFGADYNCVRPRLNDNGHINLKGCRHPLIDRNKVVPVTLDFGSKYRFLAVTGPNTGGKTVALKTAGLFCLLAASGVFLPAEEDSEAAVFDNVFSDIGDEQSITSSLSTFSSHIINIVFILQNVTKNSLVLFDELGGGTDPEEGAALAIGILKFLEKVGCCGIITTHYGQIKEYALRSGYIQNASMQFDNVTLRPTYRLVAGLPGTSNALKIAGTLGIDEWIIAESIKAMPKEKVDLEAALSAAQQAKNNALLELDEARRERSEATLLKTELAKEREKLREKQQSVQENAKAEVRRIAANTAETAAALIEEMKETLKSADEKALLEAKRLHKKIENIRYSLENQQDDEREVTPLKPADIKEGAEVFIISLQAIGRVVSVNAAKKEATVRAGAAVANIKFSNLAACPKAAPQKQIKKAHIAAPADPGMAELNVIGLTVAEALEELDSFLSAAQVQGSQFLRVVHGKGTGALGKGVHVYLRSVKSVASYRFGRYGEGDTGVTIIELK